MMSSLVRVNANDLVRLNFVSLKGHKVNEQFFIFIFF